MKIIFGFMTFALMAASFTACSRDTRIDALESNQKAQKEQARMEQERQDVMQQHLEKIQKVTPAWFLNPMPSDATGFYAVGAGVSPQMNSSMEISQLQAEFDLAKTYRQHLSGSERSYEKVTGTGSIHQYTKLVDKIVDAVPVVGFEVIHRKVVPLGDRVYTWTMLKLPYDQFNRALGQVKSRQASNQIKGEFDALKNRLEDLRQSKKAGTE